MEGYQNWDRVPAVMDYVHNPKSNGLTYLYHFSVERANELMVSPEWTRAIFFRNPKERFLSAYLEKGKRKDGEYLKRQCCRSSKVGKDNMESCVKLASQSFQGFFNLTRSCRDSHWTPQAERMEPKYWPFINFIGTLDTAMEDTKRLLQRIGAWDTFGDSGWGNNGTEAIFQSTNNIGHATHAKLSIDEYYTSNLEKAVREAYVRDFELYSALIQNKTASNQNLIL
jgi:hypothetical protein